MNKNQWQQGDVVGEAIKAVPKGARKVEAEGGWFILARGEVTGHSHRVKADEGVDLWVLEKDSMQEMYLNVQVDDAILTHEEHKPIELLRGVQKVNIVREFDHLQEMERRVVD